MKSTLSILGFNATVLAATSFAHIEQGLKLTLLVGSIVLTLVKIWHELRNIKRGK
jgi:hypothetical protein